MGYASEIQGFENVDMYRKVNAEFHSTGWPNAKNLVEYLNPGFQYDFSKDPFRTEAIAQATELINKDAISSEQRIIDRALTLEGTPEENLVSSILTEKELYVNEEDEDKGLSPGDAIAAILLSQYKNLQRLRDYMVGTGGNNFPQTNEELRNLLEGDERAGDVNLQNDLPEAGEHFTTQEEADDAAARILDEENDAVIGDVDDKEWDPDWDSDNDPADIDDVYENEADELDAPVQQEPNIEQMEAQDLQSGIDMSLQEQQGGIEDGMRSVGGTKKLIE